MAISDLSTVSAKHPRSVVRSRGTTSKLFSITTRIAALAILAAMATITASTTSAQAQTIPSALRLSDLTVDGSGVTLAPDNAAYAATLAVVSKSSVTIVATPTGSSVISSITGCQGTDCSSGAALAGGGLTNRPFTGRTAIGPQTVDFAGLQVGANTVNIVVTDASSNTQTYVLTVTTVANDSPGLVENSLTNSTVSEAETTLTNFPIYNITLTLPLQPRPGAPTRLLYEGVGTAELGDFLFTGEDYNLSLPEANGGNRADLDFDNDPTTPAGTSTGIDPNTGFFTFNADQFTNGKITFDLRVFMGTVDTNVNDDLVEGDETVIVNLIPANTDDEHIPGISVFTTTTATIQDDDVAAAPTITGNAVTVTRPTPNGVISLILNYAADISGSVTSTSAVTHFVYVGSSGITNVFGSGPIDCAELDIAANFEIPIGTLNGSCSRELADGPGGEGLTGIGAAGATITFRLRNAPGDGGLSEEATLTFAAATASASTATFAAYTARTGGTEILASGTPSVIPVMEGVPIFQRLTLDGTLGDGEQVDLTPDAPVAAALINADPDATIADDLGPGRGVYIIRTGGSASAISVEAETDDIVEGPEYFQIGGGDLLYTHGLLTPIPADGLLTYRIVDATTTNATVTLDATTVDEGGTLTATVTLDSDKMLAEAATFVLERVDATDGSPTQAEDADVSFVTVAVPAGVLGASGAAIVTITDSDGVDPGESFKVGVDLAASTYGNDRSLSDQITSVPSADVAITDTVPEVLTSANLLSLTVNSLNPSTGGRDLITTFDPAVTAYGATLDGTTTATIVATPAANAPSADIAITAVALEGGSITVPACATEDGATNTCVITGIGPGETALATILVTAGDENTRKSYTIAIGPAYARLVVGTGNAVGGTATIVQGVTDPDAFTIRLRNYNGTPLDGFTNIRIDSDVTALGISPFLPEFAATGAPLRELISDNFVITIDESANDGPGTADNSNRSHFLSEGSDRDNNFRVLIPGALMAANAGNNNNVNSEDVVFSVMAKSGAADAVTNFTFGRDGAAYVSGRRVSGSSLAAPTPSSDNRDLPPGSALPNDVPNGVPVSIDVNLAPAEADANSANLGSLTVGGASVPDFDAANTFAYGVTLADGTDEAVIVATPAPNAPNADITITAVALEGGSITVPTTCETEDGANSCTFTGIDAGETILATVLIRSANGNTSATYTIAIGPVYARLIGTDTNINQGATDADVFTIRIRNYSTLPDGGFASIRIDTGIPEFGRISASPLVNWPISGTFNPANTYLQELETADFNMTIVDNTGTDDSRLTRSAFNREASASGANDRQNFRIMMPKTLLAAGVGSNTNVNSEDVVVSLMAKENATVRSTSFEFGASNNNFAFIAARNPDYSNSSGNELPRDNTSGSAVTVTVPVPPNPVFASTQGDLHYAAGSGAITPVELPTATGGTGTISYTLTPDLAAALTGTGLSYNAGTRTISGTPAVTTTFNEEFIYRATDSTSGTALFREVTFRIVITPAPTVVLAATDTELTAGSTDSRTFTLTMTNIPEQVTHNSVLTDVKKAFLVVKLTDHNNADFASGVFTNVGSDGGGETDGWTMAPPTITVPVNGVQTDAVEVSNVDNHTFFRNRFLFDTSGNSDGDFILPEVTYTFTLTSKPDSTANSDVTINFANIGFLNVSDAELSQIGARTGAPLTFDFVAPVTRPSVVGVADANQVVSGATTTNTIIEGQTSVFSVELNEPVAAGESVSVPYTFAAAPPTFGADYTYTIDTATAGTDFTDFRCDTDDACNSSASTTSDTGADATTTAQTLVFTAGEQYKVFEVTALTDTVDESSGEVLQFSVVTSGTIDDGGGSANIAVSPGAGADITINDPVVPATSVTVTLPDDSGPSATGDILAATGTVDITVRLDEPATQEITLPFTISVGGGGALGTDYDVSSAECDTPDDCTASEDLVFATGEQMKTITVTATSGTDGATVAIVLTANDGTGLGYNGVVVGADDLATITLHASIAASFEIVNVKNQRMVINGDPGEFTLRIRNFEFPTHTGTETSDVLAVGFRLSSGTDHNGALVNHRFALGSTFGHGRDALLSPITTNGAQEITGADLSIRLTNPDNLRDYPASPTLTNLSQSYQPYIINQSSGNFRVILPRALFAAGAGRNGTENAEDVTFQIVPGGREGARPESFNLRVGGSTNGAVWGTITNGLRDDGTLPSSGSSTTLRDPLGEFPAGDSTPFHFTVVRASDAAQLPRLLNPAAQDIMRGDTTLVTVALPPIMAHADAAKAVIAMAFSANATDAGGITTAIAQGQDFLTEGVDLEDGIIDVSLGAAGRFFRLQAPADVGPRGGTQRTRDENIALFACDSPNPGHPATRTCLEPADAIVNLSVVVSGGQRLSGDVVFSVAATGTALQNRDDVVIEATSISFLNSEDRPVGETTTLTSDNVAKVTALITGPTTVLNGLTVDGNIVYLSAEGTLSGRGNVSIGNPGDAAVPVTIDLAVDADSSLVTGTNAEEAPGPLTGVDGEPQPGDRPDTDPTEDETLMISGFTAGINTLTVRVRPNGATDDSTDRVYTISVFVPPSPTDSTLASATVDDVTVTFTGDPRVGNVAIDATTTATIVATPTSSLASWFVCAANTGPLIRGAATVSADDNDFIIYVVAAGAADGTAVTAPTTCDEAQAAVDADNGTATATAITVTVATASADLSSLTVTPMGGGDSLVGFNADTLSYGVTLDGTDSATIVATPSDNNAAIAVTVTPIDGSSVTHSCVDTLAGVGANTCTVNGIGAGETAVVTMSVTVSALTRHYTVAVGPASAQLVLIPTEVAPGEANAVELTLQVRNYGLVPNDGFLGANIATNVVFPAITSVVTEIDGTEFDFDVRANTGISNRGGFGAATGGFQVIVPKALLDAGNNGNTGLVNGVNIAIEVEADEDVRIFNRTFTLGTVGALMADQSDATSVDAISDVDTDAVTLGIDATTTATLSLLGDALGADGAILVASGGMATAQVSIKNPAGGGTLTGVAFRVRTGTDDDSTTAFLTRTSVDSTEIDFGDLTVAHTLTGTHTEIEPGDDTNVAGWTLDVATVASPIVIPLTITLDSSVMDEDFYTLELAQLTTDNIGEYDYPRRVSGTDPANNGRIEVGAIEQTLVMTPGETISHAEEPADIGTNPTSDMTGRIPLTLTLDSVPTGLTEIVYQIAAGGAHAKARDVDYGIGCQRLPRISGQTNCRTGEGYDLNGVGGIDDTEQITTGTVVFPAGAFDQNVATFELQITPVADSVVEGTETVEITLTPPAGVAAPAPFTVNITDSTTSSVTVSTPESVTTVAEGTTLRVTVSLDDQGETDTDEDGLGFSTAKIVAEDTEFTLQRLDLTPGTAGLAAGEAGDDDIRLTPVTIRAGEGSGSIEMLIVPDGIVPPNNDTPESFRLRIASIAASAVRPTLAARLPADTSGGPPQWVATSEITINEDLADNTTDATLDALTFDPGTPSTPAGFTSGGPPATSTISLPADTLSVEVIATPNVPVSQITSITGFQGNDCTTGTALGVEVTSAEQFEAAGVPITATVGVDTDVGDPLDTGENCIRVVVTAGDNTTTNTYDVVVTVAESADARLAATDGLTLTALTLTDGTVGNIVYDLTDGAGTATAIIDLPVASTTETLTLSIDPADDHASIDADPDPAAGTDTNGDLAFGTIVRTTDPVTVEITGGIDDGDTIIFTVTAENDVAEIAYTITFNVQEAKLMSVSFGTQSAVMPDDDGAILTGSASFSLAESTVAAAANIRGDLVVTLVDTSDTIVRVFGTNERREPLTGNFETPDGNENSTPDRRTISDVGNLSVGTNTLKVHVRPAGLTGTDDDRIYTITLVVPVDEAERGTVGISPGGTISLPSLGANARKATFNVFTRGFNVLPDASQDITGVNFTLSFDGTHTGTAPNDAVTNFSRVGDTGEFRNNYFTVMFPTYRERDHNLFFAATTPGQIEVDAATPAFTADGTIYIPVMIELRAATLGGDPLNRGVISIVGDIAPFRGDRSMDREVIIMGGREVTPSPSTVTYNIVDGPTVTLTSEATATEAGEAPGTLDMVLTRNLAELSGVAIVTYTIGGDATRGANADYMLTVEGAPPANCNASGVGCTYQFPASTDATQTARVVVTPNNDLESEDDEMVTIEITDLRFPGASPTAVIPSEASEVTIIDNDADANLEMFSDLTIGETSTATFQVALSSAPTTALETTINLALSGNARYGATNDYDYTIAPVDTTNVSIDVTPATAPATGATVVATVATGAFTSQEATVVFTISAVPNSRTDGDKTIVVNLSSVTDNQTPTGASTDYTENRPAAAARTITIQDDDVAVDGFCSRSERVRAAILDHSALAATMTQKACPVDESDDAVLGSELAGITGTLSVDGITAAAPLKAGDFEGLNMVTDLTLAGVQGAELPNGVFDGLVTLEMLTMTGLTYTRLANGVLDDVLDTLILSGLTFPNAGPTADDLPATLSFTADTGSNAPVGETTSLTIQVLDNALPTNMTAVVAIGGGQAAHVSLSNGPGVDNTDPDNPVITIPAGSTSITLGVTVAADAPANAIGMTATLTLGSVMIPELGSAGLLATSLVAVSGTANVHTVTLTLPSVSLSLAPSAISIGEKSQNSESITLTLNGVLEAHDVATVSYTLTVPATADDDTSGIPTPLISGDASSPVPELADYIVAVEGATGDFVTTNLMTGASPVSGTFTLAAGDPSASFVFTAIDDDRREGDEKVTLAITGVVFDSANAPPITSRRTAEVTITEVSGEDVMRETQMITHVVGKEQVNLVTGLVRQRVSALTLGSPQGFSEPGVQLALAENPQTIQDFFSQMALESSGEMDDGGAFAIWAKGQYIEISGSPDVAGQDNFEYEGKIAGIGMGMEKRYSQSLVGLSMNFSTADIDSKSDMRAEGNYKETMTFFAPYAAWKPDNSRLTLWGTAGVGFGSAEITGGEDHGEGNPSVQALFAQGGVDLSENLGKTAEVVFGMSAVAIEKSIDAWTAGALNVPGTESSVFQAQADATAYFPVYSDDGQVLRPYVGLASVHDIGDVTNDDRHAMEVQTGIAWSNGPWQVSFDTFYQFLRDDEEAWGVFGEAQWSGTGDLDGLLMGVTSGHGTASSMSDAASSTDSVNSDIDTNLANADTETAEWSVQTNSEYGFAAPVVDRNGRATPFFRSTHSADARSFESGVRMDVTDNIGMTVETNRHIPADDDPYSEHAVGLEARWEF